MNKAIEKLIDARSNIRDYMDDSENGYLMG
jgi:hypothetical protein